MKKYIKYLSLEIVLPFQNVVRGRRRLRRSDVMGSAVAPLFTPTLRSLARKKKNKSGYLSFTSEMNRTLFGFSLYVGLRGRLR